MHIHIQRFTNYTGNKEVGITKVRTVATSGEKEGCDGKRERTVMLALTASVYGAL